jgi:hypothetical protein
VILVNQSDGEVLRRRYGSAEAAPAPTRLLARSTGQGGEKGPDARRRPKAAGEAYFLYVEPAAEGAPTCNYVWVAAGPLSAAWRLSVVPGGHPPAPPGSDAKRAEFAITQSDGSR